MAFAVKKHQLDQDLKWIGIPEQEFTYYKPFVNKEVPGVCGTYALAALTHYTIKKDTGYKLDMQQLIDGYLKIVDGAAPYVGTYFWDLTRGFKKMLGKKQPYRIHSTILTERTVLNELNKMSTLPIIVGTVSFLGSSYKNHWLLVYAYAYDSKGKLWYKAYDNHGNSQAVIPAVQTLSAVFLERKIDSNKKII